MSVLPIENGRSRGSLADDVCRRIADEIVLGNFAPGSRLDEVSLAARFNVSRTPIREALKQMPSWAWWTPGPTGARWWPS